jgi:hypothetical protein
MTKILFIAVFVAIFGGSFVWGCSINPPNVTHLNIWNCYHESFIQWPYGFLLDNIVHIDAGNKNNKFKTIDGLLFGNLRNLQRLWLVGCEIEVIAEDAFAYFLFLIGLDLRDNKIKQLTINTFRNNKNLLGINLADNQIEVLHPNTFQQNIKLKWLVLQSNKIDAIAPGSFIGFTSLTLLDLSGNRCINTVFQNWKFELYNVELDMCARNYNNLQYNFFNKIPHNFNIYRRIDETTTPESTSTISFNRYSYQWGRENNEETTPRPQTTLFNIYRKNAEITTSKTTSANSFNIHSYQVNNEETTTRIQVKNGKNHENSKNKLMVIIAVTSAVLIIGAFSVIITFICKARKVVKQKTESQEMKMKQMGGPHYYSTPDTPKQSKKELKDKNMEAPYTEENYYSTAVTPGQSKEEQLRRELKQTIEGPYTEVHYYSSLITPKQSKQVKQERLRQELKKKLECPYEEVNCYSTPYTTTLAMQTEHI